MDKKEAADECDATADKREGVSILLLFILLFFSDLMLLSEFTDLFSEQTQQV